MVTVTGFDLGKLFEWYAQQSTAVDVTPFAFPKGLVPIPKTIESRRLIELSELDLGATYFIFPEAARDRSILRNIMGQPITWFAKESTPEAMVLTTDEENAATPGSYIHAQTDYTPWIETGLPTADIFLYQLPNTYPSAFKKTILRHGFIHNFAHTVFQPAAYIDDYMLEFPRGELVSGLDAVAEFTRLAEQHDPISQYSAVHRPNGRKFESSHPNYNPVLAVSEEFSESVAAYFMGFTLGTDSIQRYALEDRPELEKFIGDFLGAKRV
jgi:hypothetical protein